jgi:hypothetical protein
MGSLLNVCKFHQKDMDRFVQHQEPPACVGYESVVCPSHMRSIGGEKEIVCPYMNIQVTCSCSCCLVQSMVHVVGLGDPEPFLELYMSHGFKVGLNSLDTCWHIFCLRIKVTSTEVDTPHC